MRFAAAFIQISCWCCVFLGSIAVADDLEDLKAVESEFDKLYAAGKSREAEVYARRMIAIAERSFRDQPKVLFWGLEKLGSALDEQGRYAEAETVYQRSLPYIEKAMGPNDPLVAVAANDLAVTYWHQARYSEAETLLKRALAVRKKALGPNHRDTAQVMGSLATLYIDQGRYAEAEQLFKQTLPIYERAVGPDHRGLAIYLENLANLYRFQARYAEAESLYKRSATIRQKALGQQHPEVAASLHNLGAITHDQGRYAEAEGYLKQALAIREKVLGEQHPDVGQSLIGLANAYAGQARFTEAEPLFKHAIQIEEQMLGVEHPTVAMSLNNLANIYRQQNRFAEAEPLFQRCIEIFEKSLGAENSQMAYSLANLAYVYMCQKRYRQAQALYERALALRERTLGRDHPAVAWCLQNLAELYRRQDRDQDAEKLIDRAIAIVDRAHAAPDTRFECYDLRARIAWKMGHQRDALRDLDEALDLAEQARGQSGGAEQERATFFGQFAAAYERMVAWQTELGDAEMALAAIERGRARSLLDEMNMGGAELFVGRSATEREQLARREAELKSRVAELERRSTQAEAVEARQKLDLEVAQARQELYDYYRDQRTSSPVYRNLLSVGAGPPRLRQLQRTLLADGGLMLVYLFGEEGSFLVSVDEKEARSVPLVIDAVAAKALGVSAGLLTADKLRGILTNERHGGVVEQIAHPATALQATAKLAALFKVLIAESERRAIDSGKVKRLIVVPDGPLALLPFETLVVEAGEKPKYLLDVGPPILYAPSATVLYNLAERSSVPKAESPQQPVLTVANPVYGTASKPTPLASSDLAELAARGRYRSVGGTLVELPYTQSESAWVAEGFKKQGISVAALREGLATEGNVRGNVSGRRVLHLACHGLADQAYGNFFGCLALTPGARAAANPADDGFLTLPEIYDLNLKQCDLAILSACQTNYGPQQKGEGVWALSRGFLVAGARRVVASNWLVDDEAAASLISAFCADLAKAEGRGEAPDHAAALHRAKRWVRQQPKWDRPYFWGTFVLVGPD